MGDNIQDQGSSLCVVRYAIQAFYCPEYIYKAHGPSVQPYLSQLLVVFFDDILVFSKT